MSITLDVGQSISLKDRVYTALKNEIILGKLQPGMPINMFELASNMNISNAPIREALNILHKDGFVKLEQHKQATVAEISPIDWEFIYELRKTIEPYAARIAASKIPAEEMHKLRWQLEEVLHNPDDLYKCIDSDRAIHAAMHIYNGSQLLSDIFTNLKEHSMRIKYQATDIDDDKRRRYDIDSTHEHLLILEAFEKRDGELAAKRALEHLVHYYHRVSDTEIK